jgi:hypothetical protein
MGREKPLVIPLPPDEAVADFLKVRPTPAMPRPGTHPTKPTKKTAAKKK